jgi:phage shock protein A
LTATQVLWTTIKAHQFMEAYSRRNFFEHPSISAVIARHLASHHVRPNASIEDKVRKMEAALVKFSSRVDSIESRLNSFDSKHDNLKASLKEALKDIQEQKNAQSPLRKPRGGNKNKNNGKDMEDALDQE